MIFLDRVEELSRLLRLSEAKTGGLVTVWGRRRIGKSELLKEWCRKVGGLYSVADRSVAAVQRTNFAGLLDTVFPGFGEVQYPNWRVLFEALTRRASAVNWQGPLVMDEFPYLVEADETIVSVLQNWMDAEKSRGGILLALAGSSQHMMQGLVLNQDSPLYGRSDEKIKLSPIGFDFIADALGLTDPLDAVKAYAIWGGVPRYWVAAERYGEALDDAVDELCLNPLGLFHEEPMTILQSEIPSAASLKPYLDVIGSGVNRVSEMAGRLGLPATALSKPLNRLVELGLVKREIPYGENAKSSKKSLYRVGDPFCRFWFEVMASRKSVFDFAPSEVRRRVWKQQSKRIFGAAWEDLARDCVVRSRILAPLAGDEDYWMPAGRWWSGCEHELDVVAFNGGKTRTLLGEAKWSEAPFSRSEVESIAADFARIGVPGTFPSSVERVLFLSAVESDVGDRVAGMRIITARDCLVAE